MKILRALLLLMPAYAHSQVHIDAPISGWRNTVGEDTQFTQPVNYPASSVNTQPGQSETAMIRGRIAGAGKTKPATLVVNGVAMPIELDEGGGFQRPYSFTSGSNGVEVRAPDGKTRAHAQFFDNYRGKTQARLRIVLSWDTPGTDLDLHVVSPDGAHAWYGNRVSTNGGALDVDVTTGYGPEIYASTAPPHGTYHVYVNYYGGGNDTPMLTVAQVAIITYEGTTREKQQVFLVPMRAPGELTLVKSFKFP